MSEDLASERIRFAAPFAAKRHLGMPCAWCESGRPTEKVQGSTMTGYALYCPQCYREIKRMAWTIAALFTITVVVIGIVLLL